MLLWDVRECGMWEDVGCSPPLQWLYLALDLHLHVQPPPWEATSHLLTSIPEAAHSEQELLCWKGPRKKDGEHRQVPAYLLLSFCHSCPPSGQWSARGSQLRVPLQEHSRASQAPLEIEFDFVLGNAEGGGGTDASQTGLHKIPPPTQNFRYNRCTCCQDKRGAATATSPLAIEHKSSTVFQT